MVTFADSSSTLTNVESAEAWERLLRDLASLSLSRIQLLPSEPEPSASALGVSVLSYDEGPGETTPCMLNLQFACIRLNICVVDEYRSVRKDLSLGLADRPDVVAA